MLEILESWVDGLYFLKISKQFVVENRKVFILYSLKLFLHGKYELRVEISEIRTKI